MGRPDEQGMSIGLQSAGGLGPGRGRARAWILETQLLCVFAYKTQMMVEICASNLL